MSQFQDTCTITLLQHLSQETVNGVNHDDNAWPCQDIMLFYLNCDHSM
jgi:hypothetical protein